jgi:hypothetical protein
VRNATIVLLGAASALIVSLVVLLLWTLGSASGERDRFSSLEIAPRDADVFVAINTDPTSPQWLAVDRALGLVNARDPIRRAIDQALAEVNLDWEEDILPVAGDEGFFSVPDVSDLNQEHGYVAGFRLRNTEKAREIFDDLRQRAEDEGEVFETEEYEGVTIYFTDPAQGGDALTGKLETSAGAVALFGDVLAVGLSPADVKAVVDVVQLRAPSAEQNERLQEFRQGQKEDFLVWGYADLAPVWDLAEAAAPTGTDGTGSDPEAAEPSPLPTPAPGETLEPDSGFNIPSFDTEYRNEGGALHVTERINVDFGATPRAGINRDVSTRITYDFAYDVLVTIEPLSVTRNGVSEPFGYSGISNDRTRIQIGDPTAMLTGPHTYEIQYLVHGAIINVEGEDLPYYDLVWDVTGDNWGVPIDRATATLTIPDGSTFGWTPCAAGRNIIPGIQLGCTNTQDGITRMHFAADAPIEPGGSMRFMANVQGQSGAPEPTLVPTEPFFFDEESPFGSGTQDESPFPFDFNSEEMIEELRGTYDRVGFSISSTADGFALDLTVLHAPGFEPQYAAEPTKTFESHFADRVPADTMFFFAGYDLYGQSWQPLRDRLDEIEFTDGMTLDSYLEDFATETGLDLEQDILSLLTGEYAVAGDLSGLDQETPEFRVLAMLDVADAARAQDSLDKLGQYLEREDAVEVTEDGSLQRWVIPDSDAEAVGITVSGDNLIAGYPATSVEDTLAGQGESLSGTDDWQRTLGILPAETTSIGYISIARILEEVRELPDAEESFRQATDGEMKLEDLAPIRSLGFATTSRDNGFGFHVVLFMEDR